MDLDDEDDDTSEEEEEDTDEGDTHEKCILKELIDYIYKTRPKNENWNRICKNEINQYGPIQKTKSVEQHSTRKVVYKFEMVERFLENSMYLDIPAKFLLLVQSHCLSMFALKIVLKNVTSIDVSSAYST